MGHGMAPSRGGVSCIAVQKSFRIPFDRPHTFKQRAIHPLRSYASRELHALRGITFEVRPGEFFGVIGANGSGKSTLLKCLAGIYQPDGGDVRVAGRVSPFIELGVGFHGELPALDNVLVNASLVGISPAEARRHFPEVMRFAELEEFGELKLKNYSSGMQVRLAFAAAVQSDADVHLVDEVLAVGDARFQEKCFDVFRQLKREGKTVVFVTHDLSAVERFCDRVLLLDRGQNVALGPPVEVADEYRRRMFQNDDVLPVVQPLESAAREGDGSAEILDAWFEDEAGRHTGMLRHGAQVAFCASVRFQRPMESPIFGLRLKNERGESVFVSTTLWDHYSTGTFAVGEEAIYRIDFDVFLAGGGYTATASVAYQDAQHFADRREDFLPVAVKADRVTGGTVDLPHRTRVERVGSLDTQLMAT